MALSFTEATSTVCARNVEIELEAEWNAQVLQVAARLDRRECPWFSNGYAVEGLPVWGGQGRRVRGIDALALWIARPQHSLVSWSPTQIPAEGGAVALWWQRGLLRPTHVSLKPDIQSRVFLVTPPDNKLQYTVDRYIRSISNDLELDVESHAIQALRELTWIFIYAQIRRTNPRRFEISFAEMPPIEIVRLSSLAHTIADDCLVALCAPQIRRQPEHWIWPIFETSPWGISDRSHVALEMFLKALPGEGKNKPFSVHQWLKAGVRQFAARGLKLSVQSRTPFEAWFDMGRQLATSLHDLVSEPWNDFKGAELSWSEDARTRWGGLLGWYKRHAWPQLWQKLVQHDVAGDPRFDRRRLAIQLKYQRRTQLSTIGYSQIPLRLLPLSKVGRILTAPSKPHLEVDVLLQLEKVMGLHAADGATTEERWTSLKTSMSGESYRIEHRRKASGGLRTIEVPTSRLAAAQRVLARALAESFPRSDAAMAFLPHRSPVLHALAHAGARHAVVLDIESFFGSIRPHHVEYEVRSCANTCLSHWSRSGQEAALEICFSSSLEGTGPHLPQGAPSSPVMANLAARRMDGQIFAALDRTLKDVGCVYTRYADDLVVSTPVENPGPEFLERVETLVTRAIQKQGWMVAAHKTRRWSSTDGVLTICGIQVPATPGGASGAPRELVRRGRAARHRLSTYSAVISEPDRLQARGLVAYLAAITADPGWLAWISPRVATLARLLAGPVYARAVLEGWDASLDMGPDAS